MIPMTSLFLHDGRIRAVELDLSAGPRCFCIELMETPVLSIRADSVSADCSAAEARDRPLTDPMDAIRSLMREQKLAEAWVALNTIKFSDLRALLVPRLARLRLSCARQLGRKAFEGGRFDEAESWLRLSAELAPNELGVQISWAHVMIRCGRLDDAWQILADCTSLAPSSDDDENARLAHMKAVCASAIAKQAEFTGGVDAIEGVNWDRAIRFRREAVGLMPGDAFKHYDYIMALLYAERYAEAQEVWKRPRDAGVSAGLDMKLGIAPSVMEDQRKRHDFVYAAEAQRYLDKGLPVVPCFGKRAVPARWDQWCTRMPPRQEIERWNNIPWTGIALVVGPKSGISIIDIDATDPEIIAEIEKTLPPSPWRRLGRFGVALAYRATDLGRVVCADPRGDHLFDLLSNRRIIVLPPSVHPATGQNYHASAHLADVLDELEILPVNFAETVLERLRSRGIAAQLVKL
jgi:hypothetical protein